MQIIPTHAPSQESKTRLSPQEKRFDDAWQRVIDQQKINDSFRADVLVFARETQERIEAQEKACMNAMYAACLHLFTFFSRKSLTQWQRRTLIDWVSQYLDIMLSSPFASHLDMGPVRQQLSDVFAGAYPEWQHLHEAREEDSGFAESAFSPFDEEDAEDPLIDDMFQELFAEFEQADAASGSSQHEGQEDAEEEAFFRQQRAHEQRAYEQQQEESQALKRLMKSSSMNSLFRKVAGVLHPDKEPDETMRQEKNRLMGELIQARNNQDVPRLFAFYTEYVGQSPLQELGGNLDGVIQLLTRQYQQLCAEQAHILIEDPLAGALYQRFHKKTPAATKRAVNKHLQEVQERTRLLLELPLDITSLKRLKPYLEAHYNMLLEEEFFT